MILMLHMIYMIHPIHDPYDTYDTDSTKIHMKDMVHDTYDTHDTYSQDSWSHFWDKCGKHTQKLVTFLGQIPGQMWEYTNTFVTYDSYGT